MDGFQIIILTAVITGVILVFISLVSQFRARDADSSGDYADEAVKAVENSVREADNAAEELNKLADSVMGELDNKYQELLFLYNMIDEKKKELYNMPAVKNTKKAEPGLRTRTINHPKQKEIIKLNSEGAPLPEIAKRLAMGQGEVKLILDLNKNAGG